MKRVLMMFLGGLIVIGLGLGGLTWWAVSAQKRLNLNRGEVRTLTTTDVNLRTPQRLQLTVRTAVVRIKTGSTPRLHLVNVSRGQYQVSQHAGNVRVVERGSHQHQLEIGRSPQLTVTVPPKTLRALRIDQLNGTLKLTNLTVGQLTIRHHNGTTLANRLTLKAASRLVKDNGQTTLTGLTTPGLAVTVKTGQIKVDGHSQKTHYRQAGKAPLVLTSSSGQVTITH